MAPSRALPPHDGFDGGAFAHAIAARQPGFSLQCAPDISPLLFKRGCSSGAGQAFSILSGCTLLDNRGACVQANATNSKGDPMTDDAEKPKKTSRQQVYTLVIEVGRNPGDGLPAKATGAALMIYASGVDEAEAVRETVAILKQADMAPLDVSGYGTLEERLESGDEIDPEERALMTRALTENSVVVASMTPFFD